jgi:hypothetical protein
MNEHYEAGRERGVAAGSWIVDGNTSAEQAAAILRGIADGDPQIMDLQPSPLSGEWAGESIPELIYRYDELSDDERDTACDAYEQGFSDGFWAEVKRSTTIVAGEVS